MLKNITFEASERGRQNTGQFRLFQMRARAQPPQGNNFQPASVLIEVSHMVSQNTKQTSARIFSAILFVALFAGTVAAASSVTSVSATTANGSYKAGSFINITVTFNESTYYIGGIGNPYLLLNVTTGGRNVSIFSPAPGMGSLIFNFNYTVQEGDTSAVLDYMNNASLTGSIKTMEDSSSSILTLPNPGAAGSLGANKNITIDTSIPGITSISTNTTDGSYKAGTKIYLFVVYNDSVTVSGGTPTIDLNSAGTAQYVGGSGSTNLSFLYTVAAGENSAGLVYNTTTSLNLNGATIRDAAGNDAVETLPATATFTGAHAIVIDTIPPVITGLALSPSSGYAKIGDVIHLAITADAAGYTNTSITVNGIPAEDFEDLTGGAYGVNYTIATGHSDRAAGLVPASVTLSDAAGNSVTYSTVGANTLEIIANAPIVSSNAIVTPAGSYKAADVLSFSVTYNKTVVVTGTPRIKLNVVGAATRYANFVSGNDSAILVFNYTVVDGDNSADLGAEDTSSLDLNSGTIKDLAGNNAVNTLDDDFTGSSVVVDTSIPGITSISTNTTDGSYKAGTKIYLFVVYNDSVTVSGGTPTIDLNSAGTAQYVGGSGSTNLSFLYTVAAGENSAGLVYNTTTSLNLNGATIRDAAGNDAVETLPATATFTGAHAIVIDTIPPVITGLALSPSSGYAKIGDVIHLAITADAAGYTNTSITVNGIPAEDFEDLTGGAYGVNYTIATGHSDRAAGLVPASVTLSDAAGNSVTYSTVGANTLEIIAHLPVVSSVSSDGRTFNTGGSSTSIITVTFNKSMSVAPSISVNSLSLTVNDCGDSNATTFCIAYQIPSSYAGSMTIQISGAKDLAGNTMAADNSHTFDVDTVLPTVTASSPQGGTSASSPITINVTTSIAAYCKYDTQDRSYATMAYNFSNGQGTTAHTSSVALASQGLNNIYVACASMNGSAMTSSVRLYTTYDTTSNFNYTKQLNLGWNDMPLPRVVLEDLDSFSDGNYSVVNVLETKGGIGGSYDYLYYRNGTSCSSQNGSCWLFYDPSLVTGTLSEFNDWDNLPYWIHMNASDRLELN